MTEINTFVFLDLETTDHPKQNMCHTKITEMSMVAVNRASFFTDNVNIPRNPRVLKKLTLCFNPLRLVQPGVTGLSNSLLESENTFSDSFYAINSFLEVLKRPVCLIAHNGDKYDFSLLKKYLNNMKVSFPAHIKCADSLHCFKILDLNAGLYKPDEKKPSYRLTDIYQRVFNEEPPKAHEAENDAIMTMRIALTYGKKFVDWVDSNCKMFVVIKPMSWQALMDAHNKKESLKDSDEEDE